MFKLLILCVCLFFVLSDAAYEGELCVKDGKTGTCTNINRCRTAIQDIKNRKNPQICSFSNADPIVCCLDNVVGSTPPPKPVATTTKKPASKPSDDDYVPPVYDYVSSDSDSTCEGLPLEFTAKKTGQKAFDKCIEYQEKYVYPCERGVDLLGGLSRSSKCHHSADDLIVGGTDAAQHEFPHMVMIGYDTLESVQWQCGGAVISERFILTAGHCTASRDLGPATYALIGAYRRSDAADRSKTYKIKRIIPHPQYKAPIRYNDIALMETDKNIQLDQFVVPACLHVGDAVKDDKIVTSGWGLTQYRGSTSEVLQKVTLNKFTTEQCSQKYPPMRLMKRGFDESSQLCYGDMQVSKDTCQGDSGGPILIKSKKIHCMYTIVGVTSFGRACGFVGEPGIYTRVANYTPWIESIVWPN
ncbi:serine protease snake-like [Trichoplusia ni]|uniref:trypsin n=1 Tax=Trichoplusia ni TaxID=7111 RepID=A0A7E5WTG2_TRINI|nr:serine protease snake-like [Trichoplusia ni]